MKTFIYVQAREIAGYNNDYQLSFNHAIVQAENEDEAYSKGPDHIVVPETGAIQDGVFKEWPLINDYVVEVPTQPLRTSAAVDTAEASTSPLRGDCERTSPGFLLDSLGRQLVRSTRLALRTQDQDQRISGLIDLRS